jgi:hypothetical protein
MQVADHAVFPIRSLAASFAYVAKGLRLEVCVKKFGIVDYRVYILRTPFFAYDEEKAHAVLMATAPSYRRAYESSERIRKALTVWS